MDHAERAARLRAQADLHARVAEIIALRASLDEEEKRIMQELEDSSIKTPIEGPSDCGSLRGITAGLQSNGSGVTILSNHNGDNRKVEKKKIEEAQKRFKNVVEDRDGNPVAISCHICSANMPRDVRHDSNPFLDLKGLRQHYHVKHRDMINVAGQALEAVLEMCSKVPVSANDIDRIVAGMQPMSEAFVGTRGEAPRAGSQKRKAADSHPQRRATRHHDEEDEEDEEDEYQPPGQRSRRSRHSAPVLSARENGHASADDDDGVSVQTPAAQTSAFAHHHARPRYFGSFGGDEVVDLRDQTSKVEL